MAGVYQELDHPADLLLQVTADGPARLAENALFALYDSVADVDAVEPLVHWSLVGSGDDTAQALRALLAEALYLIDTEGLLAAAARVDLEAVGAGAVPPSDERAGAGTPTPRVRGSGGGGGIAMRADLWGERLDPARHRPKVEVKAVTYHRLEADEVAPGVWRATFLLDV